MMTDLFGQEARVIKNAGAYAGSPGAGPSGKMTEANDTQKQNNENRSDANVDLQPVVMGQGFNAHRLGERGCELEASYVEAWQKLQRKGSYYETPFPDILFLEDNGKLLSDRDRKVIETTIQWLGSNIGNSFVKSVLKSHGLGAS